MVKELNFNQINLLSCVLVGSFGHGCGSFVVPFANCPSYFVVGFPALALVLLLGHSCLTLGLYVEVSLKKILKLSFAGYLTLSALRCDVLLPGFCNYLNEVGHPLSFAPTFDKCHLFLTVESSHFPGVISLGLNMLVALIILLVLELLVSIFVNLSVKTSLS